jgi:glucose-1-phosphate cytidylyltransferase
MKAVILAGGLGSRLSEETDVKPKPMVEIGGKPILWHIMKIYSFYGINDFIICLGYKGYIIKEYFANYFLHTSDVTFDIQNNNMIVHQNRTEPWKVTLVNTGEGTATGGRLKRVLPYLDSNEEFCFTYGDGVGDVNIAAVIAAHRNSGLLATVTAVQPPGRFGMLDFEGFLVKSFMEKPRGDGAWVNGGFFVLSPEVLNYIDGDDRAWEREPMQKLARNGQMNVYFHDGFWQSMDTLRDKQLLEDLWRSGNASWKIW